MLLTGVGGLTSFGQAAFVGLGAYTTAYLSTQFGLSPWLGLVAGLVITAVAAFALGAITLRLSGHYLPLGTIAWGLSLFFLFGNLEFLGKYDGINGIPSIDLFGISLNTGRKIYYLIWLVVIAGRGRAAEPAEFAPGPRDPRAEGRRRDGRGDGRQHRLDEDRHLRHRRAVGRDFRLAVRASAALGESDPVRLERRHRIPVHGGGRRRRLRLGRDPGRDAA